MCVSWGDTERGSILTKTHIQFQNQHVFRQTNCIMHCFTPISRWGCRRFLDCRIYICVLYSIFWYINMCNNIVCQVWKVGWWWNWGRKTVITLCLCVFPAGNVYNIPVCLWLLDTYPYNPPICFVKPTSAMMIKTGKHIDANGKIYLPYLHEWKHVSARSSVSILNDRQFI